jgi:cytochrome c biogenesis protein CcdA
MLALAALVAAVALADSANPSTVGPALYLATRVDGRRAVAAFALGVFAVSLLGGVVLVLGPGRALLAALPRPGHRTTALLELAAGAACLIAAAVLWAVRGRIARRVRDDHAGRSPLLLGAAIMAVELPTAFPYFAAIAAVVGSRRPVAAQLALVLLFNLVFVAPLLAILAVRSLARARADARLARVRALVDRWAAVLLPALLALIGVALLVAGAAGLGASR